MANTTHFFLTCFTSIATLTALLGLLVDIIDLEVEFQGFTTGGSLAIHDIDDDTVAGSMVMAVMGLIASFAAMVLSIVSLLGVPWVNRSGLILSTGVSTLTMFLSWVIFIIWFAGEDLGQSDFGLAFWFLIVSFVFAFFSFVASCFLADE
jgi:hypothetical protein